MKTYFKLFVFGMLLCHTTKIRAQVDPHFSQYYANPLWLNPALTGVINGDWRINSNFKNQWSNVNNAYLTGALSAEYRSPKNIGLGITVLDQSSGGSAYNHLSAYATASYGITLSGDENKRLHFGMQAGIVRRSFNSNGLQFGNQYNPVSGYDPSINSLETFAGEGNTVFDAGAGVFYYDGDPFKNLTFFGGLSANHLNRPEDSFSGSSGYKIPVRYTVHGGFRIKAGETIDIIPNALYVKQQKASIKALGAYSEIKLREDRGIILGTLYRFGDAAIADAGYHLNNLIIGASYDFNTSSLNRATAGNGGIEISVSYLIRRSISKPEPICPRL